MKILKNRPSAHSARPWLCAINDKSRYPIDGVRVSPAAEHPGYVWTEATDGRQAVRILIEADDVDAPPADGVIVPIEAFATAYKLAGSEPATLAVNGKLEAGGMTWPPIEGRFPDFQAVLPKGDPKATVALNVRLLAQMADAFGADVLELDVREPNQPVTVRPVYTGDHGPNTLRGTNHGAIMPVSC